MVAPNIHTILDIGVEIEAYISSNIYKMFTYSAYRIILFFELKII